MSFGRHRVLTEVSLHAQPGEFVALFGHNGAGKTTLLRSIAGLVPHSRGRVLLDGNDLAGRAPHEVTAGGVAFVPQGLGVFPTLTIDENLAVASWTVKSARTRGDERDFAFALFGILKDRLNAKAGSLSGGQRQMLAIAMALMTRPRLLLLDEPSTGLAPVLVEEVIGAVKRINVELGTTIVLVEQNISRVTPYADSINVLKLGEIAFAGDVGQFQSEDLAGLF